MLDRDPEAARAVAAHLLRIQAIHIRPSDPFLLTSGWRSPVYVDCRKVIAFPEVRNAVLDAWLARIDHAIGRDRIDAVAGGETAGIPYAAWLADRLDKPMLYVRKKPKGFGRNAQIEGAFDPGQRVLLVEDMATDGASKVVFVEALRAAGAEVTDSLVVFFYASFPGGPKALEAIGVRLHALATWTEALAAAEAEGYASADDLAAARAFLADPPGWSAAHGGAGA